MDLGLTGKHALVLSSSRGLGRAVAEGLAAEGADVVMTARSADQLKAAADAINAKGRGRAHAVVGDLAKDVHAIHRAATDALGGIDILVANTGGPPAGSALNVKPEQWSPQFDAIAVPVFTIAGLVLPGMRERGFGRIVTIASTSVQQPLPNLVLSNALRSSIVGWSKTLSAEVAKDGITVNMVLPGRIHTDRTGQLDVANAKAQSKTIEQITEAMLASIPAGRYGRVDEFADVVCFLASERASYITGSMIRVDGGAVRHV
ncbi:MAG: SDR family oxidoreductase [Rhizobiales bacterium]|nr:SDR family oxidoreductase [Hyphomicrobiales bacterium]